VIRVQQEDFDVGAEIEKIHSGRHEIGGVACFIGLVRDMVPVGTDDGTGDARISSMTLEHYPGMTERALEKIEAEARSRWTLDDCLIVHRYGRLGPGGRIVLVVTAAAHREAALDSCHFLIDWLKTKAPFWKMEDTGSGAKWVAANEDDEKATDRWLDKKPV
jgi:molybdopterin synthase catalytic subunit